MSTTTSGAASVPSPAATGTPSRPASAPRRHRRPAMDSFVGALRDHQELAIFVTLALGFFIGRLRFGSFSLGTVVGTLLAGVLVGQLDIEVPAVVKNVFFDLFLFTTGYKVGPQFFRGLRKDALPQLAVTVVLCVSCLLSAFAAARLLVYDMGTAAGLLAGAFTESTVIGTAADAINRLDLPAAEKAALVNNIPVAYAVTYLIGTAFIVWFLPNVGPRLMRVNLKEEARKLQAQIAGGEEHEQGAGRHEPRGAGADRGGARSVSPEDRAARRADAVHPADARRPWRRVEPHRCQARRRAGREGSRLRRPADGHHRHDFRRPRHLSRWAGRPALGDDRRVADHAHRQRRRTDHGSGVRLAARPAPDVRPDSGARHVGVRYGRPDRLHRRGGSRRGTELRVRASEIRAELDLRRAPRRHPPPRAGDRLRPVRAEDESAHPSGGLLRSGHRHGCPSRAAGGVAEQAAGARLHRSLRARQYLVDGLGPGDRRPDALIAVDGAVPRRPPCTVDRRRSRSPG